MKKPWKGSLPQHVSERGRHSLFDSDPPSQKVDGRREEEVACLTSWLGVAFLASGRHWASQELGPAFPSWLGGLSHFAWSLTGPSGSLPSAFPLVGLGQAPSTFCLALHIAQQG